MAYDRDYWQTLWEKTLRDQPDKVASKPPHPTLVAEASGLAPGRALDAGCGHGAESLWLAAHGWRVTAVDFSAAALAHGRRSAESMGVADRVDWIEADLGAWTPEPRAYDLVASIYVHVAGSAQDMVRGLADAVAPGGTLLVLGYQPKEPGQVQISVAVARAALVDGWQIELAEERPRNSGPPGVDAVIRARRH